ncbi:MAG: phosphatidylglycerol:prolipoprotein diacylglycerol transferase, partial [Flavobacteriales bacterium]
MLVHPQFDPVAIEIGPLLGFGPLQVHWYGLMYLFGFVSAWALGVYRTKPEGALFERKQIEDLIFYGAMGLIVGARVGYVFFYNLPAFMEDPLWLFRVWEGGMSFHGGMLGVLSAMLFFARKTHKNFFDVMDYLTPLAPLGLFFGRIGNFIGQELWGRETDVAWGVVFPAEVPEALVRHPSQLYEAALEGVVLFIILFWYSRKPRPRAAVAALGMMMYGAFRFFVEFFREPDAH